MIPISDQWLIRRGGEELHRSALHVHTWKNKKYAKKYSNTSYTATKIPFMYSFSGNCAASAPISTFMCLWAIYIIPWSVLIFPALDVETGSSIVGIYKSLTGTWMWKWGLWPRKSFSKNICFQFSILVLCSVKETNYQIFKILGLGVWKTDLGSTISETFVGAVQPAASQQNNCTEDKLQGLCHEMNNFLKAYYDKYVLSVHALILFKFFGFLLEWKIKLKVLACSFGITC